MTSYSNLRQGLLLAGPVSWCRDTGPGQSASGQSLRQAGGPDGGTNGGISHVSGRLDRHHSPGVRIGLWEYPVDPRAASEPARGAPTNPAAGLPDRFAAGSLAGEAVAMAHGLLQEARAGQDTSQDRSAFPQ